MLRSTLVTVRYIDDCPNWQPLAGELAELAAERGDVVVRTERVASEEEARDLEFRGSPTVLIDGVDPFVDEDAPSPVGGRQGLACRLYRTPEGSAGRPTRAMLRQALDGTTGD